MMEYQNWFDYAEFNEDGDVIGIKKDAPDEIKKEYDSYLKKQKAAKKEGIVI